MPIITKDDTLGRHNQAMWFAQDAVVARVQGNEIEALSNFYKAFELEVEVLKSLESEETNSETYGIILRSAATLAKNSHLYEKVIELVKKKRSIPITEEIQDELDQLVDEVTALIDDKNYLDFSEKILIIEQNRGIRFLLSSLLRDVSDIIIFDNLENAENYLSNNSIPKVIIFGVTINTFHLKSLDKFIETLHHYQYKQKGMSILLTDSIGEYRKYINILEVAIDKIVFKPFNPFDLKNEIIKKIYSEDKAYPSERFSIIDFCSDKTNEIGIIPKLNTFNKRLFDILFSSFYFIFLIPIFIIIAIAIKIDSNGPVFYRSPRIGFGFKKFSILKFRTTHISQGFPEQNNVEDPLITVVGRFLRNTSLDELPQIFNVIVGEMSIVGNRPLTENEANSATSDLIAERFLAPAGITGLWQTAKRNSNYITWEERMMLDVEYSRNHNFLLDMFILLRTPGSLLQSDSSEYTTTRNKIRRILSKKNKKSN